ncbi:MAG: O-antigen ligase family protein [Chitinivibrionia bacterium]|nr:O-antigen ligase family protein [Chitinivibrionia bacterium]
MLALEKYINKQIVYFYRTILPAVSMFLLFSIPSVKLIHSGTIINVGVLGLIVVAMLLNLNNKSSINNYCSNCFCIIFLFFLIMTLQLINYTDISLNEFIDYAYLLIAFFCIAHLANLERLKVVGTLIFIWGILLAVWQLTIGIPTSREFGQHYLTVSLPIGAALAYSLSILFCCSSQIWKKIFYTSGSLLLLLAITTLLSRSGIIFPLLVGFLFIAGNIAFNNKIKLSNKLYIIMFAILVVVFFAIFIMPSVELQQLNRLTRLTENTSTEPRIVGYKRAIHLILQRPFLGYGTGSAFGHGSTFFYFHNIFLDVFVMGGFVALVPFLLFVFNYFSDLIYIFRKYSHNPAIVGFAAASFMFFLQFNTSFSFKNAYISVGTMFFLCLVIRNLKLYKLPVSQQIERKIKWKENPLQLK